MSKKVMSREERGRLGGLARWAKVKAGEDQNKKSVKEIVAELTLARARIDYTLRVLEQCA